MTITEEPVITVEELWNLPGGEKLPREENNILRGYRVTNTFPRYDYLFYENRARVIEEDSKYQIEEKGNLGAHAWKFGSNVLERSLIMTDELLYKMAKEAVKKTLERIKPEVIDRTQMFQRLRKKSEEIREGAGARGGGGSGGSGGGAGGY